MGQQCRSETRTRRSRTAAARPDPLRRPRGAGSLRSWAGVFFARYGVLIAFGLMLLGFSLARPNTFPTIDNAKSILSTPRPG